MVKKALIIIGLVFIIAGAGTAMWMSKYYDPQLDTDFVEEEVSTPEQHEPPFNVGYWLVAIGVVVVVSGALVRRR